MTPVDEEPTCKQPQHGWHELGVEDSGETVSRCGSCMALKYVDAEGNERWEVVTP